MSDPGRPRPSSEEIENRILELVAAREPGRSICPSEAARSLGGPHPDGWGPLMRPVRRAAVALMRRGQVVITRKGRPVDPDDFRGVYRIARPPSGDSGCEAQGAGNSASVRPDRR